jgi:hypothetical protein
MWNVIRISHGKMKRVGESRILLDPGVTVRYGQHTYEVLWSEKSSEAGWIYVVPMLTPGQTSQKEAVS